MPRNEVRLTTNLQFPMCREEVNVVAKNKMSKKIAVKKNSQYLGTLLG